MDAQQPSTSPPEILAPAGNKASFLAAVAAGAIRTLVIDTYNISVTSAFPAVG